jgi:hypothetical protein
LAETAWIRPTTTGKSSLDDSTVFKEFIMDRLDWEREQARFSCHDPKVVASAEEPEQAGAIHEGKKARGEQMAVRTQTGISLEIFGRSMRRTSVFFCNSVKHDRQARPPGSVAGMALRTYQWRRVHPRR